MSLLDKVANREVINFLKTTTIKNSYFADRQRVLNIRPQVSELVPETCNPYIIHLAGEYILERPLPYNGYKYADYWKVKNPVTGEIHEQKYGDTQIIYDRTGELTQRVRNKDIFQNCFDEMMYVVSLDTGETIPFTLENFYSDCAIAAGRSGRSIHSKTLMAYKSPGRYFELLCKRYPKQVDLIKAIVYRVPDRKISSMLTVPEMEILLARKIEELRGLGAEGAVKYAHDYIARMKELHPNKQELLKIMGEELDGLRASSDMDVSERRRTFIAKAKHLTLMNYDDELLDPRERSNMVSCVNSILDVFAKRWSVKEYTYEENYAAVMWSMLWCILPMTLIAQRYANIKTPHACETHIWDYLTSKGLESYRGYLSEKQTSFLYKNIVYLYQHRAQQKVLNILLDEILADVGITVKSKTVVLDTTNALGVDTRPEKPDNQCASCSRCGVTCFKNITAYNCSEWLGTKHLCKADPVVITEKFTGATHDKIIENLIEAYGYTRERAENKYTRSFIWRDDEIEKIRDDLNRDQLVDLKGSVETLEEVIANEHASGNEPVFNADIVDEQTEQLQNMNGTYAPTKILELHEQKFNVKYQDLFNRFITETFLRLAPQVDEDGKMIRKVLDNYHFTTPESSMSFLFDFGEMLAAAYLGFAREYDVDVIVKDNPQDDGQIMTDLLHKISYDFAIPTKAQTSTTFKFGKPVKQAELIEAYNGELNEELQDRLALVTNRDENTKIVKIRDIVYAVTTASEDDLEDKTIWTPFSKDKLHPTGLKVLGEFTIERIGTEMVPTYFENDREIPIVPKYFRWYYNHLNPLISSDGLAVEGKAYFHKGEDSLIFLNVKPGEPLYKFREQYEIIYETPLVDNTIRVIEKSIELAKKYSGGAYIPVEVPLIATDDLDEGFKPSEDGTPPQIQRMNVYFDPTTCQFYREFPIEQFLDVDTLLCSWRDIIGTIDDKTTVVAYIDQMFNILETVYNTASISGSVRCHIACDAFLMCVLSDKMVRFKLIDLITKRDCKEGTKCAWFSDWLKADENVANAVRVMDDSNKSKDLWNEFNSELLKTLLEGSITPFAQNVVSKIQYQKLKQLVLSLCSYRITMIDVAETGRVCNLTASIVEDALVEQIETTDRIFFDPVGDSVFPPHVGGYLATREVYVPTHDLNRVEGKTYYVHGYKNSEIITEWEEPLGRVDTSTKDGSPIKVGCEGINVPTYVELDVTDIPVGSPLPFSECYELVDIYALIGCPCDTPVKILMDENHEWYYCTGTPHIEKLQYYAHGILDSDDPFYSADNDKFDLNNGWSTPANAKIFNSIVHHILKDTMVYDWDEPVKSRDLKHVLNPTVISNLLLSTNEETIEIKETSLLIEEKE